VSVIRGTLLSGGHHDAHAGPTGQDPGSSTREGWRPDEDAGTGSEQQGSRPLHHRFDRVHRRAVRRREEGAGTRRHYRTTQGGDPSTDGTKELLQTFDGLATPEPWAEAIGNKHKTSTSKGAPLKAVAVRAAAQALADLSILNKDDMRAIALNGERLADVGAAWKAVTAQSSGITWRYVLILAGVPGVKRTA